MSSPKYHLTALFLAMSSMKAAAATTPSIALGLKISQTGFIILGASNDFKTGFSSLLDILNMVGLVLCFGGLLFSAVMFMMGSTERVLYGVVGALIGGLAWVITKTMFEKGSGQTVTIDVNGS